MSSRSIALLMAFAVVIGGPAAGNAGSTHTVHKGQTRGPLVITNPPFSRLVNNGRITNKGLGGVPALTIKGSVIVINNGVISATVTSGTTARAIGVLQLD
jgi:hypothetical protein